MSEIKDPLRLRELLERVEYAASRDDTRYALNGIFLERDGGDLLATATDGHRLAQAREPDLPIPLPDGGLLLPLDALGDVRRVLHYKSRHCREAAARVERDHVALAVDGRGVLRLPRMLDGCEGARGWTENYRSVLPREDGGRVVVHPDAARELVGALSELAKVDLNHAVSVTVGPSPEVHVAASRSGKCHRISGSAHVDVGGDGRGEFCVNAHYLADALDHVAGLVELRLPKGLGPVVLAGPRGDLAVVMPVR